MFCNYCRALNPNDAVYCSTCGQTVRSASQSGKNEPNLLESVKQTPERDAPTTEPPTNATVIGNPSPLDTTITPKNIGNATSAAASPKASDHVKELSSWEYEKIGDEELAQLRAAYQKVRVPPNQALQNELERRSHRKDMAEQQVGHASDSDTIADSRPHSRPILSSGQGQLLSGKIRESVPQHASDSLPAAPMPDSSLVLPVYATMGQRFTAYFVDLIVIYLIVIAVYFAATALHLPLSASEGESQLLGFLALFIYMIVAQASYHTTIGKYVHGLEVRSDRPNKKYPALWRIFVRETIGRLFSCFFWGAGYWLAIRKPKKQAWSDEIAGTIVTTRPTNRVLTRGLTAFVLVALVLDVGIIGYGFYKEDRDKQYAAYQKEIQSVTTEVVASRDLVSQKLADIKPVNSLSDFLLWQDNMKQLKKDLDRYENQINRMLSVLQRGISENLAASETERIQLVKLKQVYELRKNQAEKYRQEADLVINCEWTKASLAGLGNDLKLLDSDIEGLETQASQLLGEIGIK